MDSVETQVFGKKASPEAQKSPAPGSETPGELSRFVARHIGPNDEEVSAMLAAVGFENLDTFIDATVPTDIRLTNPLDLPVGKSEQEALAELRKLSEQNKVVRNFIGAGYSDCVVPPAIQRNILENPGWYTAYTPYQAEIAQGAWKHCSIFRR
jgi:glycine dehydrogenase